MSKSLENPQSFYLCSGFHRSGTSLVASTLASNGVNLGDELMGPSFANPKGHFEDVPMVKLHDQILNANGTDWRYLGDSPLNVTGFFQTKLQQYYQLRRENNADGVPFGAKDPRAVFFLDNWQQATEGNLRSILVYRDWRYAISSLYKRHSRELLQFTTPIKHRTLDYQFWQYPELAARMWLASSNAMLRWMQQHPQTTLLFEQKSFVSEQQQLKQTAQDKGFATQILDCQLYESNLMQSSVSQSMLDMIPEQIQRLCFEAQERLNEAADVPVVSEITVSAPDDLSTKVIAGFSQNQPIESAPIKLSQQVNLAHLSWEDAMETLKSLSLDREYSIDWSELFSRTNVNSSHYDKLYTVAIRFKQWIVAENALHRAIAYAPYHYRYIHLGDMYMRRKMPDKAQQYYTSAQQLAPNNSVPLAKLSEVETLRGNLAQAEDFLQQAIDMDPSKPAIKQAKARLQQRVKQLNLAHSPTSITGSMHMVDNYQQIVAALSDSFEHGLALDKYMVKAAFIMRDNPTWLMEGCADLSSEAQRCLLDYLFGHLRKHWPEQVLNTELNTVSEYSPIACQLTVQAGNAAPSIGVCLHVFHPHLVAELVSFINSLPHIHKMVITCPTDLFEQMSELFGQHNFVQIVQIENRGRDILPWLSVANNFDDCDMVLKLHTKATPHSSALRGWRLQLLWMLLGEQSSIQKILSEFERDETLGMVIPNFHPKIAKHVNWGNNQEIAQQLGDKLAISLPDTMTLFPAGSMFWYRPAAIQKLTSLDWQTQDFPEESGQIDGTIMHAIERIVCECVKQSGFEVKFSQQLTRD